MRRDALIAALAFGLVALVPLGGEAYWLRLAPPC